MNKLPINLLPVCAILFFLRLDVNAQTYYSRTNGTWSNPSSWSTTGHGGAAASSAPTNSDQVIISAGHVIVFNGLEGSSQTSSITSLTLGDGLNTGYLVFPFSNSNPGGTGRINRNYTLNITGDLTINTGSEILPVDGAESLPNAAGNLGGTAANLTHNLNIGGNLSNSGTLDLEGSTTGRIVNLTFNGTLNQIISGSGNYDLRSITYNNIGSAPNNEIEITSSNFSIEAGNISGTQTFTAGTFVHNNSATYINNRDANITISTTMEIQQGVFVATVPTSDRVLTLNANLTLSGSALFRTGFASVGSGIATDITINGILTITGTAVLHTGDGDETDWNPTSTDGITTLSGSGMSTVNGGSLYTYDFTLNENVDLLIQNGGDLVVGLNNSSKLGTLSLNGTTNGSSLTLNDASSTLTVHGAVTAGISSNLTVNNGTASFFPLATNAGAGNINGITISGNNAQLTFAGGSTAIFPAVTSGGQVRCFEITGDNAQITISGGNFEGGNSATGFGSIRFNGGAGATGSLTVDGTTANFYGYSINGTQLNSNVSILNGGVLQFGQGATQNINTSTFDTQGTVTVSGSGSSFTTAGACTFYNLVVTDGGTLLTGNGSGVTTNSTINGTYTQDQVSATSIFRSGLTLATGSTMNLSNGIVRVFDLGTTLSTNNLTINGQINIDGGQLLVAENVTSMSAGTGLELDNSGIIFINNGTVEVLANPGLNSITGGTVLLMDNTGSQNSQVRIGDNLGSSNSAILRLAPNLAAQLPTPTSRNMVDMQGTGQTFIVNTDALFIAGGENIGNFYMSGNGSSLTVNGGTTNITASLRLNSGSTVTINNGQVNIGITSSNGANAIIMPDDPTAVTSFIVNGGTVTVGDGSSGFRGSDSPTDNLFGDNDNNPAFGSSTAYCNMEINGGTFTLNGTFRMRDANNRLTMSAGQFIINPQGNQSLDPNVNIFHLERGIINLTGGSIIIQNPHASSGTGAAYITSAAGNPSTAANLSGPSSGTPTTPIFTNTLQFGDGNSSLSGSSDGFDVTLHNTITYGNLTINNPLGSNREVNLTTASQNFSFGGDISISAGTLDIRTNTINRSVFGGSLTIGAAGILEIGNTNSANHFPGNTTAFSTYTLSTGSTVVLNGSGNASLALPGSGTFSRVRVESTGTVTLTEAEIINDTLYLVSGVFATGTNLTPASTTVIRREGDNSSGIMTGTLQGSNIYTIQYSGDSKTSQSAEWSGGGITKNLIVKLNTGQILTAHASLPIENFELLEGIFADGGLSHTVRNDLTVSGEHSGSGLLTITGGSDPHIINGDGTGILANVTLNDINGINQSTDLNIEGTITLSSGIWSIANNFLGLGSTSTISGSFSSSSMISTNGLASDDGFTKNFSGPATFTWPIGTSGKYTPATIQVISAGSSGSINLKVIDVQNPTTLDPANLELDYYWKVTSTGLSTPTVSHSYTYAADDITGRGSESAYIPAQYLSGEWNTVDNVTQVDDSNNTITFSSVDYLDGEFTAGEPSEFGPIPTYYSLVDGSWFAATSWSNEGFGGAVSGTIPGSSSVVLIGNGVTITIDNENASAADVDLQTTGILHINTNISNTTFSNLKGAGTLRIASDDTDSPILPFGTLSEFFSASGGTLFYDGTGDYTLPNTPSTLNNLTIGGSGIKSFPEVNYSLFGNLTIRDNAQTLLSSGSSGDININGDLLITLPTLNPTLQFPSSGTRSLTLAGNLQVDANGILSVANTGTSVHSITINGNVLNNGTINLDTEGSATMSRVNLTLSGSSSSTFSGSGATNQLHRLIINKGTSTATTASISASFLTFTAPSNVTEKPIEIQKGMLSLDNGFTLTLSSGGTPFTIPTSGGLRLNHASLVLTVSSGLAVDHNLVLEGELNIVNGNLQIGNDATGTTSNNLIYSGSSAIYAQSGGLVQIAEGFKSADAPTSPSIHSVSFSLSGGTLQVSRYRSTINTGNDSEADFAITNANSSMTMSGGELQISRGSGGSGKAFLTRNFSNFTITGGNIQVITGSSPSTGNAAITSIVPIWNLLVGTGTGFSGNVGGPSAGQQTLKILNDFTLNTGGNFNQYQANGTVGQSNYNIEIGGSLTIVNGNFNPGSSATSTVTFNGTGLSGQSSPQLVSASTPLQFGSINVNTTGTLQLNQSILINRNFTRTAGNFSANMQSVTFNSSTVAQNVSGLSTTFYDLILNNTFTTTPVITSTQPILSIQNQLTLTNGVLDIGGNSVNLTNTSTSAISVGTPGVTRMIQTNGLNSSNGLTKAYGTGGSQIFTFPLGTSGIYSPATVTLVTDISGNITVSPVLSQSSFGGTPTSALDYYWNVNSTTGAADFNFSFTYDESDVPNVDVDGTVDDLDLDISGTGNGWGSALFNGASWTENLNTGIDGSNNSLTVSVTGLDISNYIFTAGLGFDNPTTYYSRASGNWNSTGTWSTVALDGVDCGCTPSSVSDLLVIGNHTVTIPVGFSAQASSVNLSTANATLLAQEPNLNGIAFLRGIGNLTYEINTSTVLSLPASFSSEFDNAGGGTVTYGGTGSYTLPSKQTYNNLYFNGTGTKSFPAGQSVGLNGNLNITSGTVRNSTGNDVAGVSITSLNSGTLTLASGAILRIVESNFPSGFATYSLNSTSTVEYYSDNTTAYIVSHLNGNAYGNLSIVRQASVPNFSLEGNTNVNGNLAITRVNLSLGSHTLSLGGNYSRDNTNGALNANTSEVIFNGSAVQNISITNGTSETFYNLTLANSTEVDLATNDSLIISNNITFSSGQAIFDIDNGSSNIGVHGNWINNSSSLDLVNGTVRFIDLNENQEILGSQSTTFHNLTLAKSAESQLIINNGSGITVNNVLHFENDGLVSLSGTTNPLNLSLSASISSGSGSFNSSRMILTGGMLTSSAVSKVVNGAGTFTWPIGVSAGYTPVTIVSSAVTGSGNISVRSVTDNASFLELSGNTSQVLDRYFQVTLGPGITDITATYSFSYLDADVQGTETSYITRYHNGTSWINPSGSSSSPSANSFGNSNQVLINETTTRWITGQTGGIFGTLYAFNGGGGDWSTASTWSTTASPTYTAASSIPSEDNDVVINNGATVTVAADNLDAANLTLNGTLDLTAVPDVSTIQYQNLTGTGELIVDSGILPGFTATNASTFFRPTGGTVRFSGLTDYNLPISTINGSNSYRNVIIEGGATKSLSSNTTASGNLTIGMSTTVDATLNDYSFTVGGTFTNNGTFNPREGTFTLNGTGAQTLPAITFYNLVFGNSGTKTINAPLTVNNFTIQSSSGNVLAGVNDITVEGNWSGTSAFSSTGEVIMVNSGTTPTDNTLSGTTTFFDLSINKPGQTVSLSGTPSPSITVSNAFTLISGNFSTGTHSLSIGGSFLNNSSASAFSGSGTLQFTGNGAQSVAGLFNTSINNLTINKPSGDFVFNSSISSLGNNLTISSGDFSTSVTSLTLPGNLTISGGNFDATGFSSGLEVAGNVELSGGTFDSPSTITVSRNWSNNGGTFSEATSSVTFNGSSPQTISGGETFYDLILNNASGFNVTGDSLIVSNSLNLTNGIVNTSSSSPITLNDNATVVGGGSSAFVDGPFSKTGDDNFIFPVGDGNTFARFGMDNTAGTPTDVFSVEYLLASPPSNTVSLPLERVSSVEYWDFSRDIGSSSPLITLYWENGSSSEIETLSSLRVAHFEGGSWVDKGNAGTTGTAASGTISAASSFDFNGPTTFGTTNSSENPLPVELLYFTGRKENTSILLEWATASEINNDYFILEKSTDGIVFEELRRVPGHGTSSETQIYKVYDIVISEPVYFYKLIQTDLDGTQTSSPIIRVESSPFLSSFQAKAYPNPFKSTEYITLEFSDLLSNEQVELILTDLNGKIISKSIHTLENERKITFQMDINLESGLYLLLVNQVDQKLSIPLILEK